MTRIPFHRILPMAAIIALALFAPVAARAMELSMDGYPAFPSAEELTRLKAIYESARELEKTRDYAGAAAAMEQMVASGWPFELDVLYFKLGLARLYQRAEMGEQAEALLASLEDGTTSRHPLYPEIFFQLSMAILQGGDRARGLERLDLLAHRFADSDAGQRSLLILARNYRADGKIPTAWSYFDRYLATYLGRKERHPVMLEAADMFFEANETERAEQLGLQVWSEVKRYPDAGKSGLRLVRAFKKYDRTEAALRVSEDLCGSDIADAQEGCLLTAQFHETAGRTNEALAAWNRVLTNYPLTRLTVRAYIALADAGGAKDALPVIPTTFLVDRTNEHWSALMTEIGKAAMARHQYREAVAALENVPNEADRASEQRSRLLLNACVALSVEDDAHGCAWLDRAVKTRPLTTDHRKAVATWLKDCAPEGRADQLAVFQDLHQQSGRSAVDVLEALVAGWGTSTRGVPELVERVWDAGLAARDRLEIAALAIGVQLDRNAERWPGDVEKAEFALWDDLPRAFNQSAFAAVFGVLLDHKKNDEAADWLITFAEHAAGPGVTRQRGLMEWLYGEKDLVRYDSMLAAYLRWYPDANDVSAWAARQVELRCVGSDLKDAWALVESWIARLSRADARAFLALIQPKFMARGSPYIEPMNAYLLSMAETDEEVIAAHRQLGEYYLKMMDYEKATIHFEQAFGLSEKLPDKEKVRIGVDLLKAAVEAGYDQAYVKYLLAGIERIMTGVESAAIKAQAGHQLAKMLDQLGLHEDAWRMFRQAADTNPQNMSAKAALYNLAKSYAENGRDDLALSTYLEYLQKYQGESDQRFYNIALANALSVAMKSADPAVIGELQMKAEALVNGVSDPYTLLDLAQYFGRQGLPGIQDLLLQKGLDEARKVIDTAATPEERHKALEAAIKRLFKMGYYNESVTLGEQYYREALANNPATQSERLHFAQYEMLRAKLGSAYGKGAEVSGQAAALLEVAKANGYHEAAVKYLMLMANESPSRPDRFAAKEELVRTYPDSQPAFRAKVDLAGKAYAEGDKEKARILAQDALAQASGDYQKDYAENIRYNVLYINATLLDESGRTDLSAPMWEEIENYQYKDSWIYVDEIMKGESSGYY